MQPLPARWVTVDPGESTGYAIWSEDRLEYAGTTDLWDFVFALGCILHPAHLAQHCDNALRARLEGWKHLVIEDWSLYRDKAQALIGDKQDTVRGIGALQFIAASLGRPFTLQPAAIKEPARQAGAETLFQRPLHENRHANDAITHGVYWLAMRGRGVGV
jgi:hypothetical protein